MRGDRGDLGFLSVLFFLPLTPASPAALRVSCWIKIMNILLLPPQWRRKIFFYITSKEEEAVIVVMKEWSCCSVPPTHFKITCLVSSCSHALPSTSPHQKQIVILSVRHRFKTTVITVHCHSFPLFFQKLKNWSHYKLHLPSVSLWLISHGELLP